MIANCPATRLVLGGFSRARLSLTFWWVPHPAFLPYRAFLAYQVAFPPYLTYQAFPLPYLDWTSFPAPVPPIRCRRRPSTMWRPLRCSATR